MKTREVLRLLEKDGWYKDSQKGSHAKYKHPVKKGIVMVPIHRMNREIPKGTLNNILKQADLK